MPVSKLCRSCCCALAQPAPCAADDKPAFVQDIDPAARDAVAVVDAFSAAISSVRIDDAATLLDPGVLVRESGGLERSREQYLAEHAQADADFMKIARQEMRYRQARRVGYFAWVVRKASSAATRTANLRQFSALKPWC